MDRSEEIQSYILANISNHTRDIVSFTANSLGVTRTTVLRHIKHLIKKNLIFKTGDTKNVQYAKTQSLNCKATFKLDKTLDEFDIVNTYFRNALSTLNKNALDIAEYGFTEMINNAIDHSSGHHLIVETIHQDNNIILEVQDDGIGIFKKIATFLHMSDNREAILQLNKGKFTSDPSNHSGEGVFFCSRFFDEFQILANGLSFIRYNPEHDWFIATLKTNPGTTIKMTIDINTHKEMQSLFNQFTDPKSYDFNRTEILVALSTLGFERYISRSQAKRILQNLEKFEIITLDFKSVETVGQGFVDEVFRVYQNKHPQVTINHINANEDVLFMINRGLNTSRT